MKIIEKIYVGLLCCCLAGPIFAREFPLCMYGVDNPADVPLLKEAGFTCFQTYQKDPQRLAGLATAAKKHHMKVVFRPDQVSGSPYQEAAQQWPMLAWYLVDEPDVHKWSRKRVQHKIQQTRRVFAHHPQALVIGQGKTRVPYYDLPDNLMMDWYPVPHLELTSFGDNVRWAKEGQTARGAAGRPLWGVVQSFDWKEYKQHRPDNDRIGRFPEQAEIRFMSYDGILNGASGLFYFVFTTYGKPLPAARPEWWARVEAVSKELAKLRPVLEEGEETACPVTLSAPLAAKAWRYKKHLYILLLNRSSQAAAVPPELLGKEYKLLFGPKKTVQIPSYEVWILQKRVR